jgi:signal transduction histidine kinase
LAGGYSGVTIAELARRNFETNLLLDGTTLALLLAGILFTLRAATREMKLAQAKSSFVSNVSHELKTPLALIRMFAEILELGRTTSREKEHEYHHIIHRESRRLTQLIDNILDFSKIEAGRKQYEFTWCNLATVVEEVLHTYEYQITSAGFELETHIASVLPPAKVDQDAIAQAVLNLLNNAVKYSADRKRIELRVETRSSDIVIEVADHGIGIPRSEHEKIFEKFYRVSNDLVHTVRGTGLGLALVKHIVDAHGGKILVDSTPGKGSRFTILLPCYSVAESSVSESPAKGYAVAESSNS